MNDPGSSRQPRDSGAPDESLIATIRGWLRFLRRSKGSETVREALDNIDLPSLFPLCHIYPYM